LQQTYLTAGEAADYTGLSKSYLAKLRMCTNKRSGPPFVKIGLRAVRYRRADLDVWIEANLVNAAGI
jgi:excisionase family DNA binding protein